MKATIVLLMAIPALAMGSADQKAPAVYEQSPLPSGPLVARAPDFSKWEIDYYNSAIPASSGNQAGGQPGSDAPKSVTVTRTKPLWHAVLLRGDGSKSEEWYDGVCKYEVGPDSKVTPISNFNPGYHNAYLDYSNSDFPDMEFVSRNTYLGLQKGTSDWVFQSGTDGPKAWIDSTTRLPVRWQQGSEVRVIKFLQPPAQPLVLPKNIAPLSAAIKKVKEETSVAPPHD
ncbi:MAG TPA: hypothetical protein VHY22_15080 [Chthoniobacteraceae bacterium]|jgi:hypothetical protein|nr:hypothetical protein [Chthoniobacteraceae bacterium]